MTEEASDILLGYEACPECRAKGQDTAGDNLARYSDGHAHCYACKHHEAPNGDAVAAYKDRPRPPAKALAGSFKPLPKRELREATLRHFGYRIGEDEFGRTVQIAQITAPDGEVLGQKLRYPDKTFQIRWFNKDKKPGLYGQHLWRDKGKRVTITEGEHDAHSVAQVMDLKWPVVSLVNGAAGAKKDVAHNLEWLLGFEEVILFFDDDDAGRAAVEAVSAVLPPGRCKVARVQGFKDANDALVAKQGAKIVEAYWAAKTHRPDGIVDGREVWADLTNDDELVECIPYPWEGVNEKTMGLRRRELVVICSGTGMGKSELVKELEAYLVRKGETIGAIHLEEDKKRMAKGLMGKVLDKPLHLDFRAWSDLPEEEQAERRQAFDLTMGTGRVFLYDHFGSTDIDNLCNRVRYLVQACSVGWVFLDHISIVVSGNATEGDERKMLDEAMTKLRSIVQETGCGMVVVCHLKRPEGKGHEEGAQTSLSQLRGSHAIGQLSDAVIGLERNQQDETNPNLSAIRVLKCRLTGRTGVAAHLYYDTATGRLTEVSPDFVPEPTAPRQPLTEEEERDY